MSGMIKYALNEGDNYVGKKNAEFTPSISLQGVGIAAAGGETEGILKGARGGSSCFPKLAPLSSWLYCRSTVK